MGIVLLSFLGSCAPPSVKRYTIEGKEYGKVRGAFRHRWWNYYERGVSFSDGAFHIEAVNDFKSALRQREEDQRMARTYGMHFVAYFPHRELGVVYYEMQNLTAAKQELELSLAQFPTAKARFYLDRVRKALLDQGKQAATVPKISLNYEEEEVWTREDPVLLSGTVEDEQYVSCVSIAGTPMFLEGSKKQLTFKKKLLLAQGRHPVTVEAGNLLGKVARRRIVFRVDREGPLITLTGFKKTASALSSFATAYVVSGSAYDEGHVHEIIINGRQIPIEKGQEVWFEETVSSDSQILELIARDRLGNQTSASFTAKTTAVRRLSPLLASTATTDGYVLFAKLFGPKDTRPPDLKLKGWTAQQTVFLEKVYIEGQVSDENKIVSLTVNQQPILRRQGQVLFFSHMADLQEGPNDIVVEARDEAGNTAIRKISIIRKIPKALQLEERLSLTVMSFEQKGIVSDAGLSFQDNLISALVDRNRFRVIERSRLDMILQEQKLSRTQLVDRDTALKLGKLVAARSVITGSIVESRKGVEVVARLIDTETSEILETEDVYDEAKDLLALRKMAEGMAIKFHQKFPLSQGLIVQKKGKYIFTDLGKDKVKLQRRLIIYREEPIKHPVTGKLLGADNVIIGRARVTQVMPDLSKAEILTDRNISVKTMDKVITE